VLYDRNNMIDQINAGTLTFSDGSSIPVSALDNSGLGETIAFTPRTVTWVKFQVTSGAGLNVGLSEFEAFFSSSSTSTATASSRLYTVSGQQHVLARGADGSLAHAWWDPTAPGTGLSADAWAGPTALPGSWSPSSR
jgi:hypothetical protein